MHQNEFNTKWNRHYARSNPLPFEYVPARALRCQPKLGAPQIPLENACKVVRKQRTFPTPKFWNHELCCEWHHLSFLSLSVYKLLTLCVSGLNRWNWWWNSVLSSVWLRNPLAFEDGLDVKVLRPEVLVQDSEGWRYLNECTWGSFL